jgi:NADPH-dependent 2,4-dienoyl-CoA reductase/sulfur reductase-like enzyme
MAGLGFNASPGSEQPEGTFVSLAQAIKVSVNIPVIAVGRFRTPEVAEAVVAEGKADMVAIGRQLIADPHWPRKVADGRVEDIIPCISCNSCFETGFTGTGLRCSVNAAAGRELETVIVPAERAKRVFVIGGGPAGMEAARVATHRGHRVTLYEKETQLGGQLRMGAAPPYKHEIAALRDYLARQLGESGVEVRLGEEVTATSVADSKPDAVIVAAGVTPLVPEIPGIERDNVVTALDVLSGKGDVGEKVVIIGGELVGCETADFLCQQGKQVTVVRRGPEMATKMFPSNREALLSRLNKMGVTLLTGVKYEEVTDRGLVITDKEGRRRTLEADTIVLAAGAVSNTAILKAVEGKVPEVHVAGDCFQPRRILDAIHDGARIGREV